MNFPSIRDHTDPAWQTVSQTSPNWPRIPFLRSCPFPEKPEKTPRSGSCGKSPQIRPCSPKYARFRCQIMGHYGPATGMIFTISRHPCDPGICRRNAAKCAGSDSWFLRRETMSTVGKKGRNWPVGGGSRPPPGTMPTFRVLRIVHRFQSPYLHRTCPPPSCLKSLPQEKRCQWGFSSP